MAALASGEIRERGVRRNALSAARASGPGPLPTVAPPFPAPSCVRGRRTTMLADSDIHATRHARASVGGLLAGIFGEPRLYVSGGAEHQGPEGGGPVCVVYEA